MADVLFKPCEVARSVLGKDFISPEEIATARGVTYTDEQLAKFGDTLPAQEALERSSAPHYASAGLTPEM